MASSHSLDETKLPSHDLYKPEIHTLKRYHRLGFLNGFLIGLAVVVGFWAFKIVALSQLPIALNIDLGGVIVSSLVIILLATLTSWFTARMNRAWLTIIVWLLVGMLITIVLGVIPTYGRNLSVWLLDDRFAGIYVYAVPQTSEWWGFVVAGLALIFILVVLAVLQAMRLERAFNDLKPNGGLSTGAFFTLLIPALFVGFGAYIMVDHLGDGPRDSLATVHKGVQRITVFEGGTAELFELANTTGFNYSALNGVRDQLDGAYSLMIGEVDIIDGQVSQVAIITHFDSGGWIDCKVVMGVGDGRTSYLSFCADASRPYTVGFGSLITGEPLPDNCLNCLPEVNAEWQTWLQERSDRFAGDPQFERIVQQGNAVWMRASAPDGYAIDCLFTGIADVQLQECKETNG